MTRHFFGEGAQERFSQARYDVIGRMADVADERDCQFAVVAGDVFETNHVDRGTISRAFDALGQFSVPVYLLPGNHDCFNPGSVYLRSSFVDRCPDHVEVLREGEDCEPVDGLQVIGAPWMSKRPLTDLVAQACEGLEVDGPLRVLVAHGQVDALMGSVNTRPSTIRLDAAEKAIEDGKISYLALGDRHSCTRVGASGRVWYSGAPEPTDYQEEEPGAALVVDLEADQVDVERVDVGRWQFEFVEQAVEGDKDLEDLAAKLDAIEDRARTVVKLALRGSLTLRQQARLEDLLDRQRDVFAAVEEPERHRDVALRPDDDDFRDLDLRGYVATAQQRLQQRADGEGEDAEVAADALALLVRLAGEED